MLRNYASNFCNAVSIMPFPFTALKLFDIFCFDSRVGQVKADIDGQEFKKARIGTRYVVTQRSGARYNRFKDTTIEICNISALDKIKDKPDLHGYSLNPKWLSDRGLNLTVLRLGNLVTDDPLHIPDRGNFLASVKGAFCRVARIETLTAVKHAALLGGYGIHVSSRYGSYYLLAADNFATPYSHRRGLGVPGRTVDFPQPAA